MPIFRNSILWTRDQIGALVKGRWLSGAETQWFATGVRREPSLVMPGDLFITAGPLGCEQVVNDVNELFVRGAVAVITAVPPSVSGLWGPVLLVADTRAVYETLAADARARSRAQIIGVTGSVGKTGTKDAIAHALSHQGTVLASPGTANSEEVVLELLCQLSPGIDYAVAELGMLGPNSMSRKAALCQPNVALITAIGSSHRHHHDSEHSIARTKSDILTGVQPGGTAVLPRDSRYFDFLAERAKSLPNIANIVTFGRHTDADVRLVEQRLLADGTEVEVVCRGRRLCYRVGLPGAHHALNSLAVLAVVEAVGADVATAAATLNSLAPGSRRGERFRIEIGDGVCEIIDDTWNASPESVAAAIQLLALRPLAANGRRVAALGDMLELGPRERELHRGLAEVIQGASIDVVHTVGPLMRELRDALPEVLRGRHFASSVAMAQAVPQLLLPGDCLLVKGSHATEMSRVVTAALARRTRPESTAPRGWNLAVEIGVSSTSDGQAVSIPERGTGLGVSGGFHRASPATNTFFTELRGWLATGPSSELSREVAARFLADAGLPASFWGFAVTLYQPGIERLMVVRAAQASPLENVRQVMRQIPQHPRFGKFDVGDWQRCRMQVDVIVEPPESVALAELSAAVLPAERRLGEECESTTVAEGQDQSTEARDADRDDYFAPWQVQVEDWITRSQPRNLTRFEFGVDGLRIVKDGKRRYFLPGDAFVHSILGMGQLRRHIQRLFPGDDIEHLTYYRFRSLSFISGVEPENWLPLYRGLPPVPEVDDDALLHAASAGTRWIADSLQPDGRFTYYYDAASDTQHDHEHPHRDWKADPYYNLLRHAGGAITLLLEEEFRSILFRRSAADEPREGLADDGQFDVQAVSPLCANRRETIERALDFFADQLVEYETPTGKRAAYALYNRKAKLGGSGVGLYALALYERVCRDDRYAEVAQQIANHLVSELDERGEFRYYHIYLDQPVAWQDNQRYFSFYYPGEAVLGLSHYCQHVCRSEAERQAMYAKVHEALRFLLHERPRLHQVHYQTLPADSWLMAGINDLWDVPGFQRDDYKQFVFDEADQMVRLMYTREDALYPDYVGSFYYNYGDHPYPDGARAEGLQAAYHLATTVGDAVRIERYNNACNLVASATLRLCNTRDSVYSVPNPERAIGGIRFKLTRQWFRVDTIQHVASFYFKLLAMLYSTGDSVGLHAGG